MRTSRLPCLSLLHSPLSNNSLLYSLFPHNEKRIWVGADHGVTFEQFRHVVITCGSQVAWDSILDATGVKYGKPIAYAVGHFPDVYFIMDDVVNKNLEGVAETTGSEVIAVADMITDLPGLDIAYDITMCLKAWWDVGVEAGVFDDMRTLGLYIDWKLHNWYCTNKPIIISSFPLDNTIKQSLSPTPNIKDGYIVMRFTLPWSRDSYRSHNVNVYLNDIKIGSINNIIPEGHYTFRFDPSILNYADSGFASNKITVATENLNGGHYIVSTDIQVILPMKKVYMYVVASNQNEANEIIKNMSDAMRNEADIGIYSEDIKFSNLIHT